MRQRLIETAMVLGCFAAIPASAQPATDPIEAMVADYVEEAAVGLPDFIIDAGRACFLTIVEGLEPADRETMLTAPYFIDGINVLAAARPELPQTLFPALDACGGTINAGEVMWVWVLAGWAEATEEARTATGSCLIGAVDNLGLDAKRGTTGFRFGDFGDAIAAMLNERPDLAGTIVEDMAACGVELSSAPG